MTDSENDDNIPESDRAPDPAAKAMKMAKLAKKLPKSLVEELNDLPKDDLKARIVRCAGNIRDTEASREADSALEEQKAKLREMAAPYKDAINMQKTISSFCALLLED